MKNNTVIFIIIGITIFIFSIIRKKKTMFELIIAKVLKHEGGYINDPDDLGGETKYGITKLRYPNLDIKNLTKEEAIEIYRRDFYIPLKIDEFKNINLALNYMDMAVNAGKTNATKILTEAKEIAAQNPASDIVEIYKDLRREYYKKVATYRNNQKFLAGWLNRVNSSNIT